MYYCYTTLKINDFVILCKDGIKIITYCINKCNDINQIEMVVNKKKKRIISIDK